MSHFVFTIYLQKHSESDRMKKFSFFPGNCQAKCKRKNVDFEKSFSRKINLISTLSVRQVTENPINC